jgi:hypothetical protein
VHQFHDELVFDKVEFGRALSRILLRLRTAAARGPTAMVRVADGDDGIECQLLNALGAPLSQSAGGAKAIRAVRIRPLDQVARAAQEQAEELAKPLEAGSAFDILKTPGKGISVSVVSLSDFGPLATATPHPPASP